MTRKTSGRARAAAKRPLSQASAARATRPVQAVAEPNPGRDEIVRTLHGLFGESGFDGVSLSGISAATGLGKSSLYYHFPSGKADMAAAVVELSLTLMRAKALAPLLASIPHAARIDAMLGAVDALYCGGESPCVLASLLVSGPDDIRVSVQKVLQTWIATLAGALREAGASRGDAQRRATSAVIQIQGALVVARGVGDKRVFRDALATVRALLMV